MIEPTVSFVVVVVAWVVISATPEDDTIDGLDLNLFLVWLPLLLIDLLGEVARSTTGLSGLTRFLNRLIGLVVGAVVILVVNVVLLFEGLNREVPLVVDLLVVLSPGEGSLSLMTSLLDSSELFITAWILFLSEAGTWNFGLLFLFLLRMLLIFPEAMSAFASSFFFLASSSMAFLA